jgi:hypothetical protein
MFAILWLPFKRLVLLMLMVFASTLYFLLQKSMAGAAMSEEIRYYKGKYKVKVVTKSVGYWIVEAREQFEDVIEGEKVTVRAGERRIVPSNTVGKRKSLPPSIKEHAYELKMEKKLKRLVAKEEKKQSNEETQ